MVVAKTPKSPVRAGSYERFRERARAMVLRQESAEVRTGGGDLYRNFICVLV